MPEGLAGQMMPSITESCRAVTAAATTADEAEEEEAAEAAEAVVAWRSRPRSRPVSTKAVWKATRATSAPRLT